MRKQLKNVNCKLPLVVFFLASFAFAAEPSTDDYDRQLLGDPIKPQDNSGVDANLQKRLQKELGAAAEKEANPKDPLLEIAKEMREVPPRLDRGDSGETTQHLQRQIVADLAKLIEQAKQSGQSGSSNSKGRMPTSTGQAKPGQDTGQPSGNSSKPAAQSDPKNRKPDGGGTATLKGRAWTLDSFEAALQAHDRGQMNELPGEYFLPDYKLEIQDYFRRLSEDRPEEEKQ